MKLNDELYKAVFGVGAVIAGILVFMWISPLAADSVRQPSEPSGEDAEVIANLEFLESLEFLEEDVALVEDYKVLDEWPAGPLQEEVKENE